MITLEGELITKQLGLDVEKGGVTQNTFNYFE